MPIKMAKRQGQYLAFIHFYTKIHGQPPAEIGIAMGFKVSPPTVHQMVLKLYEKGLITRIPGQARTFNSYVVVLECHVAC